jgi:hypothetical protein
MAAMRQLQPITHRGRLVAVVVAGQAMIRSCLSAEDLIEVQAKCLYALELADAGRAAAYTDTDADAYARAAARQRSDPSARQP